jgi:hypothetical protein
MHYIGKNPDNKPFKGKIFPIAMVRDCCEKHKAGDPDGLQTLQRLLPTLLHALKISNRDKAGKEARNLASMWAACVRGAADMLGDKPVLYSDESLSESVSGLTAHLEYGDAVPLEQLDEVGFLRDVMLSVVLREPAQFLKASYYKAMEFEATYARQPVSFEEYIKRQLQLHERKPAASRIFLGRHRTAAAHFRALCPRALIVTYEQLLASPHVLDKLLGTTTDENPISLATLPRENRSWRNNPTNEFILSAPGVPHGISIDAYANTFPETLRRYGLDKLFAEESLSAK